MNKSDKSPYRLNISDGELYEIDYTNKNGLIQIDISLLRGEGIFILLSREKKNAITPKKESHILTLTDFTSFVSRRLTIDTAPVTVNTYSDDGEKKQGLHRWERDFSGEVRYISKIPALNEGEYILDLENKN